MPRNQLGSQWLIDLESTPLHSGLPSRIELSFVYDMKAGCNFKCGAMRCFTRLFRLQRGKPKFPDEAVCPLHCTRFVSVMKLATTARALPWMFFLCLFATYWKELYLDLTKTLPYAALTHETLWTHQQTECTLSLSHTQSSYNFRMFDWTPIGNSWEVWETKDKPSEWKVKHDPMAIWTSPYLSPSCSDSEPESDSTTCSKPLSMEAHWLSDSLDILVLSATTWSLKMLNWADWFWNCTWRINWQAPLEPLEPLETWHLMYGKKLYGTFQIKLFGQSLPNCHLNTKVLVMACSEINHGEGQSSFHGLVDMLASPIPKKIDCTLNALLS